MLENIEAEPPKYEEKDNKLIAQVKKVKETEGEECLKEKVKLLNLLDEIGVNAEWYVKGIMSREVLDETEKQILELAFEQQQYERNQLPLCQGEEQ